MNRNFLLEDEDAPIDEDLMDVDDYDNDWWLDPPEDTYDSPEADYQYG